MELLLWVRGPGFDIALAVFLFGILLRLFEVFGLGRKHDLAPPRQHSPGSGLRTVLTRSFKLTDFNSRTATTYVAGYIFHIGLFVVIFLFIPHIEIFQKVTGLSWPGISSSVVDFIAVLTLIALLVTLGQRLTNPVKRLLTTIGDYWGWLLTFLPVLTGYMAYHHLFIRYESMLAVHILCAETLLVFLPFTKLAHSFTLFIARWYNGDIAARKGVAS